MSDNDCISRSALYEKTVERETQARHVVEKHMNDVDKTEWRKWLGILAERSAFKFAVANAPAVEQPMIAAEFLKEFERMCKVNGGSTIFKCSTECPVFHKVNGYLLKCKPWVVHHPEEAVALVEKWAKEHPEERSEK